MIKDLEDNFERSMESFESRFATAAALPSTLQQLAKDFQQFKSVMRAAVNLLRAQIAHLSSLTDEMESRSRRKFLMFRGVKETAGENTGDIVCDIINSKLKLPLTTKDIQFSFRLGTKTSDRPRPVLVKFASRDSRNEVWHSKKGLKDTTISLAEFLTPIRRRIFSEGRRLYGIRRCWSQDGVIFVKLDDGSPQRILSELQLKEFVLKHPPVAADNQGKRSRAARTHKK